MNDLLQRSLEKDPPELFATMMGPVAGIGAGYAGLGGLVTFVGVYFGSNRLWELIWLDGCVMAFCVNYAWCFARVAGRHWVSGERRICAATTLFGAQLFAIYQTVGYGAWPLVYHDGQVDLHWNGPAVLFLLGGLIQLKATATLVEMAKAVTIRIQLYETGRRWEKTPPPKA